MALRVTMRAAEDASLLAYQAVSTVRRKRKATVVITTPRTVRKARVLLRRQASRAERPRSGGGARGGPLVEPAAHLGGLGGVRIVRHHQHRLAQGLVEGPEQAQHF